MNLSLIITFPSFVSIIRETPSQQKQLEIQKNISHLIASVQCAWYQVTGDIKRSLSFAILFVYVKMQTSKQNLMDSSTIKLIGEKQPNRQVVYIFSQICQSSNVENSRSTNVFSKLLNLSFDIVAILQLYLFSVLSKSCLEFPFQFIIPHHISLCLLMLSEIQSSDNQVATYSQLLCQKPKTMHHSI